MPRTALLTAALTGALLAPVGATTLAAPAAASQQSFGDRVVSEAARHDGKDYRYGATGPDAFDCSGYVQFVFRAVGVELPRTSAEQYAASQPVDKAAAVPGDLLAFHDSRGRVTHVGIYAGDHAMWVASTGSDRVRLQEVYTDAYRVGRLG